MIQNKTLDSVLSGTDITGNMAKEVASVEKNKSQGEEYVNKDIVLEKKYDAVSKNGDTLELSENGKKLGESINIEHSSLSGEKVVSCTGKQIPESILSGYSEAKLKQLYANKEISKQQYNRAMKKKNR